MKVRQGYTLVEVVVAMLLSAVMITSVFTVALSNKHGGLMLDSKLAAGNAAQTVVKMLGNYVTADPTQTFVAGPTCVPGPNPPCTPGPASWSVTGYYYTDSQGSAWALWPGSHTITGSANNPGGLLPTMPNGSVTYFVAWPAGCSMSFPLPPSCTPSMNVTVNWPSP